MSERRGGRRSRIKIARRSVQIAFLGLFIVLVFSAAYPPLGTPPANLLLRLDPLAAVYSLVTARSASVAAGFWPAWVLLGLTALSARFFCGWLCPLGTCFDLIGDAKPKAMEYYRPHARHMKALLARQESGRPTRRVRLKYLLLALVLGLGLLGVNLLYFASPLVVANRGLYYVFLPQVPWVLLLLLLLAVAYRPRYWCDELCPMGALMSLVSLVGKRLRAGFSPISVSKEASACIDCGACYKNCEFGVAEPYVKRDSGRIRSADCSACGDCLAACPSGGALSLESFGLTLAESAGRTRRSLRRVLDVRAVSPAEPRLTVSRSEFLGSLGLGAVLLAGYGLGVREVSGPVLRMPGAQNEARFLAECNRCGECSRTCPAGCLRPMGLDGGLQRMWTPRFQPRAAGCIFDQCDQACARVCPAGAIERQKPRDVRIGVAQVNRRRCLGWRGEVCLVCQERCRFNAVENNGLRPVVNEDRCTGCGACEQTCPTEPASIQVFRTGEQASWPSGGGGGRGRRAGAG